MQDGISYCCNHCATVTLQYEPNKAGLAGDVVDALFANPEERLAEDLRNFKQYAERRVQRVT